VTRPLQGAAAIVGAGQTEFSKNAGRSETRLAGEAILAALADAGLGPGDVDGLVSYTIDPVEETELVRAIGIQEVGWSSRVPYGGGGSQGVLLHAAAAVASGAAMVPYTIIKEVNPDEVKGSATGAMNFLVFSLSAFLAPVFGFALMHLSGGKALTLENFQQADTIWAAAIVLSLVLTFFLRETGAGAKHVAVPAS